MDLTQQNHKDRKRRNNKSSLDLSTMVYGKVPPQAKDLEEAVLGAMMIEASAFTEAGENIRPDMFYVEGHQRIYRAMQRLAQKSQPIDILTVVEELRKTEELEKVGGAYYVTKLTNAVVSSANIRHHARIVLQKFLQREVVRVCGEMIGLAYEDSTDAFELLDELEEKVLAIRQSSLREVIRGIDDVVVKILVRLEHDRHIDRHMTGVTAGHKDLDYVTCGWQSTDLVIIAARPSVGKTAFAVALAGNAAKAEPANPVAIFSLEMTAEKLGERLLASESGVWIWNIINARLDDDRMAQLYRGGVQPIAPLPIYIDDNHYLTVAEFRAKARRLVNKYGVRMIIIDYLQLMSAPAHIINREQQISHISRELKACAKELKIPVIALSQMSRDVDKSSKFREPQLSDLRESGAIEQDADLVMFLWRPDPSEVATRPELIDIVYLAIKKNRQGALAKFLAKFKGETQKYEYVTLVDNSTMEPVGEKWRPTQGGGRAQGLIDYTQSKREGYESTVDPKGPDPF